MVPLFSLVSFIALLSTTAAATDVKAWPGKWFPQAPARDKSQVHEVKAHRKYDWSGQWFPHPPWTHPESDVPPPPPLRTMGSDVDPACDDAHTNLRLDFDPNDQSNAEVYICEQLWTEFRPSANRSSRFRRHPVPEGPALHKCMNESITYAPGLPTAGTHRPLWLRYGEYTYAPPQRWMHNLEHGAVVALYHPCSNHPQRRLLKRLVRDCLYRHVITPSKLLSPERPFALIAWGVSLEFSAVHGAEVRDFIRTHALQAPERTPRDGQYDALLTRPATVVSDRYDTQLCPGRTRSGNSATDAS